MTSARLRLGVVSLTLTLVAALVGNGAAWWLSRPLDGAVATTSPEAHVVVAASGSDPCTLLDRPALFGRFPDVACGVHAGGDVAVTDLEAPLASCPTTLRLVGAVVPRRGEPFAAIVDATGASLLYTEGMAIGEREVAAIGPQHVVLAQDQSRCVLSMFATGQAAVAPSGDIVTTEAGTRQISRALVDRLTSSGELLTSLRAIPHLSLEGTIDGYRIYGVREGSPSAQLGLENGDVVTHVDDGAITDVSAALDALARVQTAQHASVRVTRRGETQTLRYEIR
jgi:type II secretory pathway component PulC